MASSMPWSASPPNVPSNDPNELLRRIASIETWVKYGFVAVIILLVLIAIGF